jgi:hypothetical protein
VDIRIKYIDESENAVGGEYVVDGDGIPMESDGLVELRDALQVWKTLDGRTFGIVFPSADGEPLIVEILSGLDTARAMQHRPRFEGLDLND